MTAAEGVFVTGTDTEVGKTVVSTGLLQAVRGRGLRVAGYKPVAAGCRHTPAGWRNEDALALASASALELPYDAVNPVALPAAIAPHLAAEDEGLELAIDPLVAGYRALSQSADWILVEGAGGWRVPLNADQSLADLAGILALPVLMVVAIRLGCISHALLTAEAIAADGLTLAGWVANRVRPDEAYDRRQLDAIRQRLPAPLLGVVPECGALQPDWVAGHLDVASLL